MRNDAPNSAVVQSQKVPAAEISVKRVSVTDVADGRVPCRHFRSRTAAACSAQLTRKIDHQRKTKTPQRIRCGTMGGTRLELVTSTMSTWRSNQLS
jgi:hypothetical protein